MSSMYPFGGAAGRSCMRCGSLLGTKESQCSRCGTYNPLPQGQPAGIFQQGAPGPAWGTQSPQAPQFPQTGNNAWPGAAGPSTQSQNWQPGGQTGGAWPQNNLFAEQSQSAMSSQLFQQNSPASSRGNGSPWQNQSTFNNTFSSFQQNPSQSAFSTLTSAARQQGQGAPPWSTLNSQNKPAWMKGQENDSNEKKRSKAGVVAIIIVLLFALVGGGAFAAYKLLKSPSSASTSPPVTIVTPNVPPLFHETFKNNNAGWDTTQPAGAKLIYANNGKLVLESDNNKIFQEPLPGGKVYSDFRLDVDVGLTSGDPANGYGVYIRSASTQNSPLGLYYRLELYGDGSFVVYKGTQDASGNLHYDPLTSTTAGPNKAIYSVGKINHVTIVAKGSQFVFFANGTQIATLSDNSYKSGTVALFVSNVQNVTGGAQATFENLAIFPVH